MIHNKNTQEENKITIKKKNKNNKKDITNNNMFQDKTENKYKILDLIDIKYLDDFENWRNIVWSMKKENYSKEDAIQLSKKSNKYDEKGFNNVWENSPSNILFSQGTLNYFSKLSNQEEYFKLVEQEEKNNKKEILNKIYFNSIKSNIEMDEELKRNIVDYENKNKTIQKKIDTQKKQFKLKYTEEEFKQKKEYFEKVN